MYVLYVNPSSVYFRWSASIIEKVLGILKRIFSIAQQIYWPKISEREREGEFVWNVVHLQTYALFLGRK